MKNTLFKKIILSVIITETLVFGSFTIYSIFQRAEEARHRESNKKEILKGEFENVFRIEQQALTFLDHIIDLRQKKYEKDIHDQLKDVDFTKDSIDLTDLRLRLGLNPDYEDVFLVNPNFEIVDATYVPDIGLDLKIFGDETINLLQGVITSKQHFSEDFHINYANRRFRKFAYYPLNNDYILELGMFALEADSIHQNISKRIDEIIDLDDNLLSLKLYSGNDNVAYSLLSSDEGYLDSTQLAIVKRSLNDRVDTSFYYAKNDTNRYYSIYTFENENFKILKNVAIFSVERNKPIDIAIGQEIDSAIWMFLIVISILFLVVSFNIKRAVKPLGKIISSLKKLEQGDLSVRTSIDKGVIEFKRLSAGINSMANAIETGYNQLNESKLQIEETHREITDSINYAERIQKSFLATTEMLNDNLSEYFIFFKPKDVVSGDFYSAGKLPNGNFAIVNADSTGHGVPGAIMSILNLSSIHSAIEQGLSEPADIFNEARKRIINRLKKDGSAEGGKDGMDASIISLNPERTKLNYCAAQNPIWVIRAGEVIQIKAEKMPVGKHDNDHIPFLGGEMELERGDQIYTLTDGFQDQFGGPKGKKFMIKKMREYILSISHLPMQEQHQKLEEVFINWKGDVEQIDDVCVVGIKV